MMPGGEKVQIPVGLTEFESTLQQIKLLKKEIAELQLQAAQGIPVNMKALSAMESRASNLTKSISTIGPDAVGQNLAATQSIRTARANKGLKRSLTALASAEGFAEEFAPIVDDAVRLYRTQNPKFRGSDATARKRVLDILTTVGGAHMAPEWEGKRTRYQSLAAAQSFVSADDSLEAPISPEQARIIRESLSATKETQRAMDQVIEREKKLTQLKAESLRIEKEILKTKQLVFAATMQEERAKFLTPAMAGASSMRAGSRNMDLGVRGADKRWTLKQLRSGIKESDLAAQNMTALQGALLAEQDFEGAERAYALAEGHRRVSRQLSEEVGKRKQISGSRSRASMAGRKDGVGVSKAEAALNQARENYVRSKRVLRQAAAGIGPEDFAAAEAAYVAAGTDYQTKREEAQKAAKRITNVQKRQGLNTAMDKAAREIDERGDQGSIYMDTLLRAQEQHKKTLSRPGPKPPAGPKPVKPPKPLPYRAPEQAIFDLVGRIQKGVQYDQRFYTPSQSIELGGTMTELRSAIKQYLGGNLDPAERAAREDIIMRQILPRLGLGPGALGTRTERLFGSVGDANSLPAALGRGAQRVTDSGRERNRQSGKFGASWLYNRVFPRVRELYEGDFMGVQSRGGRIVANFMEKGLTPIIGAKPVGDIGPYGMPGGSNRYGRAYDSVLNTLNKRVTNISQMAGTSLYGMGMIGATTALAGGTMALYSEAESQKTLLAGMVNNYSEFIKLNGEALEGQKKFNASLGEANILYSQIRKQARESILTTRELMDYFVAGAPHLMGKGMTNAQSLSVIDKIATLGKALGLPQAAVISDIRDLAMGRSNSRSQVLQAIGIKDSGELKEAYKKGGGQGLYRYVEGKLAGFDPALETLKFNPQGVFNKFMDDIQQMGIRFGAIVFTSFRPALLGLMETMEEWERSGSARIFAQNLGALVSTVTNIASGLGSLGGTVLTGASRDTGGWAGNAAMVGMGVAAPVLAFNAFNRAKEVLGTGGIRGMAQQNYNLKLGEAAMTAEAVAANMSSGAVAHFASEQVISAGRRPYFWRHVVFGKDGMNRGQALKEYLSFRSSNAPARGLQAFDALPMHTDPSLDQVNKSSLASARANLVGANLQLQQATEQTRASIASLVTSLGLLAGAMSVLEHSSDMAYSEMVARQFADEGEFEGTKMSSRTSKGAAKRRAFADYLRAMGEDPELSSKALQQAVDTARKGELYTVLLNLQGNNMNLGRTLAQAPTDAEMRKIAGGEYEDILDKMTPDELERLRAAMQFKGANPLLRWSERLYGLFGMRHRGDTYDALERERLKLLQDMEDMGLGLGDSAGFQNYISNLDRNSVRVKEVFNKYKKAAGFGERDSLTSISDPAFIKSRTAEQGSALRALVQELLDLERPDMRQMAEEKEITTSMMGFGLAKMKLSRLTTGAEGIMGILQKNSPMAAMSYIPTLRSLQQQSAEIAYQEDLLNASKLEDDSQKALATATAFEKFQLAIQQSTIALAEMTKNLMQANFQLKQEIQAAKDKMALDALTAAQSGIQADIDLARLTGSKTEAQLFGSSAAAASIGSYISQVRGRQALVSETSVRAFTASMLSQDIKDSSAYAAGSIGAQQTGALSTYVNLPVGVSDGSYVGVPGGGSIPLYVSPENPLPGSMNGAIGGGGGGSLGAATTGGRKPFDPKSPYVPMAIAAAKRYGVPVNVFLALIDTESSWNTEAVSRTGAKGLGQFMPKTWEQWGRGGSITDPGTNLDASARYLKHLHDTSGSWESAIKLYHSGRTTNLGPEGRKHSERIWDRASRFAGGNGGLEEVAKIDRNMKTLNERISVRSRRIKALEKQRDILRAQSAAWKSRALPSAAALRSGQRVFNTSPSANPYLETLKAVEGNLAAQHEGRKADMAKLFDYETKKDSLTAIYSAQDGSLPTGVTGSIAGPGYTSDNADAQNLAAMAQTLVASYEMTNASKSARSAMAAQAVSTLSGMFLERRGTDPQEYFGALASAAGMGAGEGAMSFQAFQRQAAYSSGLKSLEQAAARDAVAYYDRHGKNYHLVSKNFLADMTSLQAQMDQAKKAGDTGKATQLAAQIEKRMALFVQDMQGINDQNAADIESMYGRYERGLAAVNAPVIRAAREDFQFQKRMETLNYETGLAGLRPGYFGSAVAAANGARSLAELQERNRVGNEDLRQVMLSKRAEYEKARAAFESAPESERARAARGGYAMESEKRMLSAEAEMTAAESAYRSGVTGAAFKEAEFREALDGMVKALEEADGRIIAAADRLAERLKTLADRDVERSMAGMLNLSGIPMGREELARRDLSDKIQMLQMDSDSLTQEKIDAYDQMLLRSFRISTRGDLGQAQVMLDQYRTTPEYAAGVRSIRAQQEAALRGSMLSATAAGAPGIARGRRQDLDIEALKAALTGFAGAAGTGGEPMLALMQGAAGIYAPAFGEKMNASLTTGLSSLFGGGMSDAQLSSAGWQHVMGTGSGKLFYNASTGKYATKSQIRSENLRSAGYNLAAQYGGAWLGKQIGGSGSGEYVQAGMAIGSMFGSSVFSSLGAAAGPAGIVAGAVLGGIVGSIFGKKKKNEEDPAIEQHRRNVESLLAQIENNTNPRNDLFAQVERNVLFGPASFYLSGRSGSLGRAFAAGYRGV